MTVEFWGMLSNLDRIQNMFRMIGNHLECLPNECCIMSNTKTLLTMMWNHSELSFATTVKSLKMSSD